MAIFDSGHLIAKEMEEELKAEFAGFKSECGITPMLVIITVGENKVNSTLVDYKRKLGKRVGVVVFVMDFPENVTEEKLLGVIMILNTAKTVHAIDLQLHFPKHLNARKLCKAVCPRKDVNEFNVANKSESELGPVLGTCFAKAAELLIMRYNIQVDIEYKVVGIVVDKKKNLLPLVKVMNYWMDDDIFIDEPLAETYLYKGDSNQLTSFCRKADILITMCATPNIIKANMVKPNAIIIDLGICPCRKPSGEVILFGNTDFEEVKNVAHAILPTPGTFGPVTMISLMFNVYEAACLSWGQELFFS